MTKFKIGGIDKLFNSPVFVKEDNMTKFKIGDIVKVKPGISNIFGLDELCKIVDYLDTADIYYGVQAIDEKVMSKAYFSAQELILIRCDHDNKVKGIISI